MTSITGEMVRNAYKAMLRMDADVGFVRCLDSRYPGLGLGVGAAQHLWREASVQLLGMHVPVLQLSDRLLGVDLEEHELFYLR